MQRTILVFAILAATAIFSGSTIHAQLGDPCAGCKSTPTSVTAGTTGVVDVSILISETRNGTCRMVTGSGCAQARSCKVTYVVRLLENGSPADGSVKLSSAEVDPSISKETLDDEDWETEYESTDETTGLTDDQTLKTGCDKKTFLEAYWQQATASATLECGECDANVEHGSSGN